VNSIVGEVETLKVVLKDLQKAQQTPLVVEPQVKLDQFNALTNDFNVLKTVHADIISKISSIESSVEKSEEGIKEIAEQVASVKTTLDNLHTETQNKNTPSVTIEDVQSMIDNAINSLIGVLTASTSQTVGPLPTILEVPLETTNGLTEDEVVDEIQGSVDSSAEANDVSVIIPSEAEIEVQEPIKKKGRGGRKPSSKK
jgi:hypothetical protein